jgi:hypothetical protein
VLTRRLTLVAAALGLTIVASIAGGTPFATADGGGGDCPPNVLTCDAWGGTNPPPPPPGGGGGNGGGNGGGSSTCRRDGVVVPCYIELLGWFNASDGCYYKAADPQPPGGPEGQTAYLRSCGFGPLPAQNTVWLADPPPGFAAPPDPAELAERALAQLTLMPPVLGTAPEQGKAGLVGLPVWLWVVDIPNPTAEKGAIGPLRATESERGVTVNLTARVASVRWTMGDGETVVCEGLGTRHTTQTGRSTCGHDGYAKPGEYDVVATTTWSVTWAGGGESGEITGVTRSSDASIEIEELQVVTE